MFSQKGYLIFTFANENMFLSLFVCQQIIQNVFDKLMLIHSRMHVTRGNDLRLLKTQFKYDFRKYYFSNKVVDLWNS